MNGPDTFEVGAIGCDPFTGNLPGTHFQLFFSQNLPLFDCQFLVIFVVKSDDKMTRIRLAIIVCRPYGCILTIEWSIEYSFFRQFFVILSSFCRPNSGFTGQSPWFHGGKIDFPKDLAEANERPIYAVLDLKKIDVGAAE